METSAHFIPLLEERMKHTILNDEKNELVRCKIVGDLSGPESDVMVADFLQYLKNKPVRQVLFDLTDAGTIEKRAERQNVVEMIKRIMVTEVAAVGGSAVARMLAKIIYKMTRQEFTLQFFQTDEEAIDWLKNARRAA
jgi:hypothetical protein